MKSVIGQSFFSADLPAEELAAILRRVEANIAQRATVEDPSFAVADDSALLPDSQALAGLLRILREQQAPFFVVHGRKPADLLRLALNLPIRVFGYKQARFNRQLLNLLDETLTTLQGTRRQLAQQKAEIAALRSDLSALIAALTVHNSADTNQQ